MNSTEKNPFIISHNNPHHKRVLKRNKKEKRFKHTGFISVFVSIVFLAFLLFTIFSKGLSGFITTKVKIELDFSQYIDTESNASLEDQLRKANYRSMIYDYLKKLFPDVKTRAEKFSLYSMVSRHAYIETENIILRDYKKEDLLKPVEIWVKASSMVDMYMKGKIDTSTPEERRNIGDKEIQYISRFEKLNKIDTFFNKSLFTKGDSREPENAGVLGSIVGSFFVIIICMLAALPLGVAAAIYLEEFAPKNKLKNVVEIAINNLAAIPSIVYGLLGLAIFLNWFGMPRSSALAGGLTLGLLVLPVIIIATRNSLAAVPPSIRDAAIGLGASKMQVVFHHVLPLSLPGIMTGSILSMARALGETAPLLMIGMVAFIKDIPQDITDPATAIPVQIYIWSDLPEIGFVEKTSAAIIILLAFLTLANGLAVYLRKKFEYKW
jgi:phosphate transport system permease protein